jgi:hypothetical protein
MQQTGKRIRLVAATAAALLAGCSSLGLVYNRLDTLARFQIGRYVDLEPQQQAEFDRRFDALWRWHRTTQVPLYAQDLRELQQATAAPLSAAEVRAISERMQDRAEITSAEALRTAAPTLASLSDRQVQQLLGAIDERAAKERRKQQKLSDSDWAEKRADEAIDRLREWAGSVTPAQRQRIELWAASLARPPADAQAQRRQLFAELMQRRREPDFGERLQGYGMEPFSEEAAAPGEKQRAATGALLADLSRSATPQQRKFLYDKLGAMARELETLAQKP